MKDIKIIRKENSKIKMKKCKACKKVMSDSEARRHNCNHRSSENEFVFNSDSFSDVNNNSNSNSSSDNFSGGGGDFGGGGSSGDF